MLYKTLGRTGLILSDLALGTMTFGEQASRGTSEKEALDQIAYYLDRGGNHIDTANGYAQGASEQIVGKGLKGKRADVILATKVRFPSGPGRNGEGLSRWTILSEVEKSLTRLQTDYLDLLYMHAWDPLTDIEESLRVFDELVKSGKVRYIGVSNFKAWQLMKSLAVSDSRNYIRFCAAQYQYSLVKRDLEYEFPDLFESEKIGLLPWGPLGGGFLSGKYSLDSMPTDGRITHSDETHEESWERRNTERNWKILKEVDNIAKSRNVSHVQVAIAWLKQKTMVTSVILGARTLEQLKGNMAVSGFELGRDEMSRLDKMSALPELYPYRFLEDYAARKP